ncbi:NAD(P)/FAD-dependent oxidoreductase [Vogesella sp. LIG4]|uniref:NAD(P)/FAD-dependent oxidoreductase n=1 Tax=Vogesella sp. LIG4 TaxID=1192162 RepID=UPI00081FA45D|nr:FAD-dependent oxidoreductase [Vogesella sp. LIG4]SCK18640.1 3-phenylpropionate/trans-cinnamate dioxygenase ferredoxin reductase subunit [Vogesella sp. LIG4]
MHPPDPIIIVGAGHAGGRAALALREQGYAGRLLLIGDEPHLPYERPALSKQLLLGSQPPADCHIGSSEQYQRLDIERLAATRVSAIAPASRQITLHDGRTLGYHKLLLATGGRARQATLPGANLAGIQLLRTLDDAAALRPRLQAGQRLVVVGGGFIGLEVAASASQLGCQVTVLEAGDRLAARALPPAISARLLQLHQEHGVTVRLGCSLRGFIGSGSVAAAELADGERLPCDSVVVGIGIQPNTELAAAAGLAVGSGIRVDERLQSSDAHIYAVGDACEFPCPQSGLPLRLETWRNAEEQGRHVARSLLGADEPYAALTWFWSDQFDHSLQLVGSLPAAANCVSRELPDGGLLLFHLDAAGRLQGACGWGAGNSIARDIKLAEMLIASGKVLEPAALATPDITLKTLLKGASRD